MRDPEGERLANGLFIGEAALGPFSLELPVQIRWQPHGCFDRGTGAHTTPLLKFGIFLRNANAERCASRVYPARRARVLRSSLFQYQNKRGPKLQVFYQKSKLDARDLFRIQNEPPLELGLQCPFSICARTGS